MKTFGKAGRLAVVTMVTFMLAALVMPLGVHAAGYANISNYTRPGTLVQGSPFVLKGTITSDRTIKRVEIGIVDAYQNKWTAQKYDNRFVYSKSFNIARADWSVRFGQLPPGLYRYRIYAHTTDGQVYIVLNHRFTIEKKGTAASKAVSSTPTISGHNLPPNYTAGKAFNIKGAVKCSNAINRIEVGIVNANTNQWTGYKYDRKVNTKSFNLADAASTLKFNKLPAGIYRYRIYAHTSNGVAIVLNHRFTVTAAKPAAVAPKTSNSTSGNTNKKNNTNTSGVRFTGYNLPGTYNVGTKFVPVGTISSDQTIKRVEVGIVFAPSGKWTDYKYDSNINSKSFNVAKAASTLQFNKLPGGTYRYRIYAHTAKGVTIVLNHKFTVKPSNKPQKAVNWARKIANDNSFTYGAKPYCHDLGCYFCGTNQRIKPKGYEKTYVCLTFVGAAYAHGAGDPEILARCKRGQLTVSSNNANFSMVSCWMKLGAMRDVPFEDLQPGDVLVDYSEDNGHGHVWMYVSGDTYVDAGYSGWGADTIAVRSGAKAYYNECAREDRANYVMRYRY